MTTTRAAARLFHEIVRSRPPGGRNSRGTEVSQEPERVVDGERLASSRSAGRGRRSPSTASFQALRRAGTPSWAGTRPGTCRSCGSSVWRDRRRPVRRRERDGHRRRPDELVAERLDVVDAVAVRRDDRQTADARTTPVYANASAVEIGRSTPPTGRSRSAPSNAIAVEPPPSSAIPVTAPSRTSACASSKFVMPTLQPGCRPSTATSRITPVRSCPTRASRVGAQLCRRELLPGAEHGRTVADDLRAAADRRDDPRPARRKSSRAVMVVPTAPRPGVVPPRLPARQDRRRRAGSAPTRRSRRRQTGAVSANPGVTPGTGTAPQRRRAGIVGVARPHAAVNSDVPPVRAAGSTCRGGSTRPLPGSGRRLRAGRRASRRM